MAWRCAVSVRLLTVTAITAGLAGCGGHSKPAMITPPRVTVTTAERQSIAEVITADAEVFAYRQASLSPKILSPIYRYFVNRGEHVHKGQLLAILENRDLAAEVESAKGQMKQAEANYTRTSAATVPQQLQKLEADVTDAEVNLDAQQQLYDNRMGLYEQGAIAGKELDQSAVALTAARTQYETALKRLSDYKVTVATAMRQSAAGQLESARAKKNAAETQLRYSELRSPIDGVIAFRNLYPGDIAPVGTALIIVMDVSKIIAKLHLPQEKAARLAIGDSATIHVEGEEDQRGRISVLSPALDPNSTTSEVWVLAPNPRARIHPGSSAEVSVFARTVPEAVVVPTSAIIMRDDGSTTVVILRADNTVISQKVKLGIQQGAKTQILSGVSAGQVVISSGGYGLPDGTKVRPLPEGSEPVQSAPKQPFS